MDKITARRILSNAIQDNNDLFCLGHYMSWDKGDKSITLDDKFTIEELEAIIWWMKSNGQEASQAKDKS